MLERDKIKNKRMLVKVYGAAVQGIDATIVTIEVNSSRGIKILPCRSAGLGRERKS